MARRRNGIPTGTARVQAGHKAVIDFEVAGGSEPTADFIHHMKVRYPLRMRRLRSDVKWLQKHAEKYGADPRKVTSSL